MEAQFELGPRDVAAGTDVTGRRRVYGSATVPGAGWQIHAGAERSAALAGARRLAWQQAEITAVGLFALTSDGINRYGRNRTKTVHWTIDGVSASIRWQIETIASRCSDAVAVKGARLPRTWRV